MSIFKRARIVPVIGRDGYLIEEGDLVALVKDQTRPETWQQDMKGTVVHIRLGEDGRTECVVNVPAIDRTFPLYGPELVRVRVAP